MGTTCYILVDEKYCHLVKFKFVLIPYVELLRIMSFLLSSSLGISYLMGSIVKPRHIIVGMYTSRLKREIPSK